MHELSSKVPLVVQFTAKASFFNEEALLKDGRRLESSLYYQYQDLTGTSSIRLLVIEAVERDYNSPISCRLVELDISSNPKYLAVSYEWGEPSIERKEIYVNGLPYLIRTNLYHALERFRQISDPIWSNDPIGKHVNRFQQPRYFWIDAICINQENISERNDQVQMMGEIYKNATNVLIWLGLPTQSIAAEGSDNVLDLLHNIGDHREDKFPYHGIFFYRSRSFEFDYLMFRDIIQWCNQTYWHRMWIVQEIQLANSLHIYSGTTERNWESITKARKYFENNPTLRDNPRFDDIRNSLAFRLDDYREKRATCGLDKWMTLTEPSTCLDPRDKIYALLGLATDTQDAILADYSKSYSEVYQDVMMLYRSHANLDDRSFFYDSVRLSQYLQRTLSSPIERVCLSEKDIESVWVCGLLAGAIKAAYRSRYLEEKSMIPMEASAVMSNFPRRNDMRFEKQDNFLIFTPGLMTTRHRLVVNSSSEILSVIQKSQDLPTNTPNEEFETQADVRWITTGAEFGYGPSNSQVGDFICKFPNTSQTLVLRKYIDRWELLGRGKMYETCLVTEAHWRNKVAKEGGDIDISAKETAVCLQLSMVLLQRLTEINSTEGGYIES